MNLDTDVVYWYSFLYRPWMDQLNKKTRKQARARETPFNDLWIRIDNKK